MFVLENTVLLVIDIQEKLAHLMHKKDELFHNTAILIKAFHFLNIPVIVTEQVPEKIGKTISEIAEPLEDEQPIDKACFSCWGNDRFVRHLEALNRKQIIVTGIETHICVYQTVCNLLEKQYEVQVVGDAVSSRTQANKYCALDRIKLFGGGVTSTEMIILELLKTSEHAKFKEIINLIK